MIINASFKTHDLARDISEINYSCNTLADLIYASIARRRQVVLPRPVIYAASKTWASAWMHREYLSFVSPMAIDDDDSRGVWMFKYEAGSYRAALREKLRSAQDRAVSVNLLIRGY